MLKTVILSVFLAVVGIFLTPSFRTIPSPIVEINDGKLQGRTAFSRDGKPYFEFLSIPFSEPPVGDLRFEAPVPLKKPWTGIRHATAYPPFCLQADGFLRGNILGVEDCLYLNVFTSDLEVSRAVIVYIHGGAYNMGSSNLYNPDFLMDEDIVLCTINYRVGAFGFMNLQDGRIRGNMGLKDQNLALLWVQKNIAHFGGDPNRVTLMGESAGASSVEHHMIAPASKGLFHRAILQSGAFGCPWAFRHNPKKVAEYHIEGTKCWLKKGDELVECLKKIDGVDLVKRTVEKLDPLTPMFLFGPTVETVMKEDTFISENPRNILKSGKIVNNVPAIFGVTSGEGSMRTARIEAMPETLPEIDKKWEQLAARLLFFDDADVSSETAEKLRNMYFGNAKFTENWHDFKRNFSLLASDVIFFEPVRKAALLHAKDGMPTFTFMITSYCCFPMFTV